MWSLPTAVGAVIPSDNECRVEMNETTISNTRLFLPSKTFKTT